MGRPAKSQTEERQLASHELPSSPFALIPVKAAAVSLPDQPEGMGMLHLHELRIDCGHLAGFDKYAGGDYATDCRFKCGSKEK